jgi:hypothetical protein
MLLMRLAALPLTMPFVPFASDPPLPYGAEENGAHNSAPNGAPVKKPRHRAAKR